MSIILGPYDNRDDGGTTTKVEDSPGEDELFVFGYACKLFRDDDKGLLENSGQLLIPWMGDGSLMIDRYDLRNRLEDKSQFGLKPILPRRKTQAEDDLEDMLDKERYLALGVDILEHQLLEEESRKRQREQRGGYQAVGFTYRESEPAVVMPNALPLRLPEHPPTSTVDVAESDAERFVPPVGLAIPPHIQQPVTKKLHSIIERTAGFVARQGTQMEIMIKAKQKHNPLFSFLSLFDALHPYYRCLLQLVASGRYTLTPQGEGGRSEGGEKGKVVEETKGTEVEESDSGDEDSDDEGFELHPLLRISTTPRSSPRPPGSKPSTKSASPETAAHSQTPPTSSTTATTQSSSFLSKSLSVNAAPSLDPERGGAWQTLSDHTHTSYPRPSLESQYHLPEETAPNGSHHSQWHTTTEGYTLHPQASDFSSQSSLEAYYHRLRADHLQSKQLATGSCSAGTNFPPPSGRRDPGPPPPPPDIQPIIDKTAEYVARNSDDFERTVLERHCGDPKFGFLNPWNQFYPYYKFRLQLNKERAAKEALGGMERDLRQRLEAQWGKQVQKLSQTGAVSFKLQSRKRTAVEIEAADLHGEEEEEEEVEEGQSNLGDPREDQQETIYMLAGGGQESGQLEGGPGCQQEKTAAQMYHGDQVHYSAEGMVYNGNGEEVEEEEGGVVPPAKRSKTAADESTVVMDNKVQEFLSQVKAVLDT